MQNSLSFNSAHFFFSIPSYTNSTFNVLKIKGEESLCDDYQFIITVICSSAVDDMQLIGSTAYISWDSDPHPSIRHGIISHIISLGMENNKYLYSLTLRSPLYPLRLSCHNQTFRDKDINRIISDLLRLNEWSNHAFRFVMRKQIPTIEYITQINQTDFEFIHSLLMRYGLIYYFEQLQDYATWVICDSEMDIPNGLETDLNFQPQTLLNSNSFSIFRLQNKCILLNNHFKLNEYNYLKLDTALNVNSQNSTNSPGVGVISLQDQYYEDPVTGNLIVSALQQQLDCRRFIYASSSNYRNLMPGQIICLSHHPQLDWNTKYRIMSVSHETAQDSQTSLGSLHKNIGYRNNLKLITSPFKAQPCLYQPPISSAISLFQGMMLGKIMADNYFDQSAAVDQYGRYIVLLPFDKNNKLITIPLRLLQTCGGNHPDKENYGCHFPLTIGTVVLLNFINGNINRPIILGVVPNIFMPNPVNANNHTQNRITTIGAHQMLFEEQKGLQKIHLQTPQQSNSLVLDATQNNHKIALTSSQGQLQMYAQKNINITSHDSIKSYSRDSHHIIVTNQQKLVSQQQSILLQSGNDLKLNAQNNINLTNQNGVIKLQSNLNIIAQIVGSYTLQSHNGNWNTQLIKGNIYCMSYQNITLQVNGGNDILLKQGASTFTINNTGNVLMRSIKIYLSAPEIKLQKNVLVNGNPLVF